MGWAGYLLPQGDLGEHVKRAQRILRSSTALVDNREQHGPPHLPQQPSSQRFELEPKHDFRYARLQGPNELREVITQGGTIFHMCGPLCLYNFCRGARPKAAKQLGNWSRVGKRSFCEIYRLTVFLENIAVPFNVEYQLALFE